MYFPFLQVDIFFLVIYHPSVGTHTLLPPCLHFNFSFLHMLISHYMQVSRSVSGVIDQ